jgi:hypothetical protein
MKRILTHFVLGLAVLAGPALLLGCSEEGAKPAGEGGTPPPNPASPAETKAAPGGPGAPAPK